MNKIKKIITTLLLIVALFAVSVQPALAAGNETWYNTKNYDYAFTFTDDNLTPYKTIGNSGELVMYGYFYKADSSSYSNIKLTAQIRDYPRGKVLGTTTVENIDYPISNFFVVKADVKKGQKVQIYFDASSINNPPGPYRKAYVNYTVYIAK